MGLDGGDHVLVVSEALGAVVLSLHGHSKMDDHCIIHAGLIYIFYHLNTHLSFSVASQWSSHPDHGPSTLKARHDLSTSERHLHNSSKTSATHQASNQILRNFKPTITSQPIPHLPPAQNGPLIPSSSSPQKDGQYPHHQPNLRNRNFLSPIPPSRLKIPNDPHNPSHKPQRRTLDHPTSFPLPHLPNRTFPRRLRNGEYVLRTG